VLAVDQVFECIDYFCSPLFIWVEFTYIYSSVDHISLKHFQYSKLDEQKTKSELVKLSLTRVDAPPGEYKLTNIGGLLLDQSFADHR
jgi:hypothetical protein